MDHLLTIDEYAALGASENGRYELHEGCLVISPSPAPRHMRAVLKLANQLEEQLPEHLCVVPDVDIDLQLAPKGNPGFSRRPDLVVIDFGAMDRVSQEGGLLRASEVLVVVEIVSPGSRRTDYVIKRAEYADAGIPHYWIVDLDDSVSMLACQLVKGSGYRDAAEATGTFTLREPFPIQLQLDRLI